MSKHLQKHFCISQDTK